MQWYSPQGFPLVAKYGGTPPIRQIFQKFPPFKIIHHHISPPIFFKIAAAGEIFRFFLPNWGEILHRSARHGIRDQSGHWPRVNNITINNIIYINITYTIQKQINS